MEERVRVYFWPYNIFGYLLPGLVLFALSARASKWGSAVYGTYWNDGAGQPIVGPGLPESITDPAQFVTTDAVGV